MSAVTVILVVGPTVTCPAASIHWTRTVFVPTVCVNEILARPEPIVIGLSGMTSPIKLMVQAVTPTSSLTIAENVFATPATAVVGVTAFTTGDWVSAARAIPGVAPRAKRLRNEAAEAAMRRGLCIKAKLGYIGCKTSSKCVSLVHRYDISTCIATTFIR